MSVKRYRWHDDGMWWLETEQDLRITAQWVKATDFDALAKRLEEAERDAARYRWLRGAKGVRVDVGGRNAARYDMYGSDLDAHIDTFLKARP